MNTTTLIAGIDYTAFPGLADAALQASRSVLATINKKISPSTENTEESDDDQQDTGNHVRLFEWNRSSPLSARTLILHAENNIGPIHEGVLVFDTYAATLDFPAFSADVCSRAVDELIAGYLFLTAELLARFSRNGGGRLVFMLREQPSLAETILMPSLKNKTDFSNASVLSSVAAGAFKSFAENTAASYLSQQNIHCILTAVDPSISYSAAGSWIFDYIGELESQKNNRSPKQIVQWIKYGSRPSSGFQFFKR